MDRATKKVLRWLNWLFVHIVLLAVTQPLLEISIAALFVGSIGFFVSDRKLALTRPEPGNRWLLVGAALLTLTAITIAYLNIRLNLRGTTQFLPQLILLGSLLLSGLSGARLSQLWRGFRRL